jgi:UrcA family protein
MSRTAHCLVTLAAAALGSVAAIAGAADLTGPSDQAPSTTVRYADLDLQSAKGVAILYHRLSIAARQVCPEGDASNLHMMRLSHECQQAAIQRAVNTIGSPMLARVATDHAVSND